MKNIFFLTTILFTAAIFSQSVKAQTEAQKIELCSKMAQGATLLESYPVQLVGAKDGERAPDFKKGVALRKGNRFRFTICTDEESAGEAIIQLYNEGKLLVSNVTSDGRILQGFDFECKKSAEYVIIISIKDGKEGSAIALLSHVKAL